MISHQHKFLYIHITKTAGTSIEHRIQNHYDQLQLPGLILAPQHADIRGMTALNQKNQLNCKSAKNDDSVTPDFGKYFSFSFVRNPWDRMVSFYFHHRRGSPENAAIFEHENISFKDFMYSTKSYGLTNTRETNRNPDQISWLEKKLGTGLAIDFVGRFENLQADFDQICDHVNLPKLALRHHNKTHHLNYREYYDTETKKIVAKKYQRDIEKFRYTF